MPVYEYYCRTCDTKFEKLQPISKSADPAVCPDGHNGALRTLSLIASVGNSESGQMMGGGCACGGHCSCG
jgi:putative FmdB family regulatory protein